MNSRRALVAATTLTALLAMSALAAIAAAGGTNKTQAWGNQLAGSWDVTVDRAQPLPDLRSLQTFTGDGSVVEIANGGTASRTSSHGAWERIEGRLYASTMVFFRFDPQTGAYLGTQKINRTLRLSPDGSSFSGIGVSALYDPAGNVVVAGLRAPEAGTRIQVERIPDQPS